MATAKTWKKKIIQATKDAGTYQPHYSAVIDTLSQIMADRDAVRDDYIRSGEHAVIMHTNKGGASNLTKNPLLVVIGDLNTQALAYWRDLGLTPKGFKALNAGAVTKKEDDHTLESVLKGIGI